MFCDLQVSHTPLCLAILLHFTPGLQTFQVTSAQISHRTETCSPLPVLTRALGKKKEKSRVAATPAAHALV